MKKALITTFIFAIAFIGFFSINKANAGYWYTAPAPYTHPWSSSLFGGNLLGGNSYYNNYNSGYSYPYNYNYTNYNYQNYNYQNYNYNSGYSYPYNYNTGYTSYPSYSYPNYTYSYPNSYYGGNYPYGSTWNNGGYFGNNGGWYGGITFSW